MHSRTLLRALAGACLLAVLPASAATFQVGTPAQLVSAINTANATPGPDMIRFTANIALTTADNSLVGYNGVPVINSDITVDGAGFELSRSGPVADAVIAPDRFRFLYVNSGTLTVINLRLANGVGPQGGAIHAATGGNLEIRNSTFTNNVANSAVVPHGGAVYARGPSLLVSNSTFTANRADGPTSTTGGGAIFVFSTANARIENSTFDGNIAQSITPPYAAEGGAVKAQSAGLVFSGNVLVNNQATGNVPSGGGGLMVLGGTAASVTNNTFSGNSTNDDGGGMKVFNNALVARGNTFIGNTATDAGGGIWQGTTAVQLSGNILAGNTAGTGPNCSGAFFGADNGSNTAECPGIVATVVVGADISATLANNGGPTQTHALLAGSSAENAGGASCPATDQRGATRAGTCDAGAFEMGTLVLPTVQFSPSIASYAESSGTATVVLTVTPGVNFAGVAEVYIRDSATGTATAGTDYTDAGLRTLTIDCSSGTCPASVSFNVALTADALYEGGETINFAVAGTNGLVSLGQATFTATIFDAATVTVSAADPVATENPAAQGRFVVDLGAVNAIGAAITVSYAVTGTATSGADYTALSGSVSIPNGQQTAEIFVVPVNDPDIEAPETVIVTLTGTSNAFATASATPATVTINDGLEFPGVATGLGSAAGDGQAVISFTAAPNGGSAITTYTVSCAPGPVTATGASSPITVLGLANGTAYSCSVRATNGVGQGAASATVNVTPVSTPGAPTIGVATPGNGSASIAFTPPGVTGGSPITGYQATCNPGAITATSAASPVVVTGLTNGTGYSCTVAALNAQGTGPSSGIATVTPVTVPGAPTGVTAAPGNGNATISFTAPVSTGGSVITSYTATCNPGGLTATGAGSPLTVAGLTNGTAYACSVRANNAVGAGTVSATANVTPSYTSYSSASATGTGTIAASFTGGGASCAFSAPQFIPLTGHARSPPAGSAPGATTFPHGLFDFSLTGCVGTITMTVVYPAAVTGATYWKYGPTASNTAPHWYTLPATVTGNTIVFSIADGGLGDDDLTVNGTIVDQGGPGVPGSPGTANAIPTLSEWMLMLLATLMLGMTMYRRRSPG